MLVDDATAGEVEKLIFLWIKEKLFEISLMLDICKRRELLTKEFVRDVILFKNDLRADVCVCVCGYRYQKGIMLSLYERTNHSLSDEY